MASSPLGEMTPFDTDERPLSVLLVDDDASLLELSEAFLQRELPDVDTTAVTEPSEALTALEDREFDCIVCDFDMPGMDGLELLTAIRETGVKTPFVLFTGKSSVEIASQAISAGVDEYLQKGGPEEYPVLANKIENLAEKHWAEVQVKRGFLAIESAEEGIAIIDDAGRYQYLNEAYAAVYDRDRAEILGEHWDMLYADDETQRFHEDILPKLEAEGRWRGVSTGITKDGQPVPEQLVLTQIENGGHVCIVQELVRDDEIEAELSLKDKALDAAQRGIVITDATHDDNPMIYVNEGFEELTGYDESEAVGRNCRFLQGEETDPETVKEIREAVANAEAISTEIRNYDADGNPFWNLLEIFPLTDEDGTVTNFVGFQRELTERKTDKSETESQRS